MPTATTILRRIPGVYSHNSPTSFFRFEGEDSKKLRPARIMHRLCQSGTRHWRDVQLFVKDGVVLNYQLSSVFMVKVLSLTTHLAVQLGDARPSFVATLRAAPLLAQAALCRFQFSFCSAVVARGGDKLTVRSDEEIRIRAKVYTHLITRLGKRFVPNFAHIGCVPFASFPLYRERLWLALQWAVLAHPDVADVRQVDTPRAQKFAGTKPGVSAVVPDLLESKTVPAVRSLEPRIAWILTHFDATKEALKRLIQLRDNALQHVCVYAFELRACRLNLGQVAHLFKSRDRLAALLVGVPALLQSSVVQLTGEIERVKQRSLLRLSGVQTIAKGFQHLDRPLIFNVLLDDRKRSTAHRAYKVGVCPKRRKTAFEVRELGSKQTAGTPLERLDGAVDTKLRVYLKEQMYPWRAKDRA